MAQIARTYDKELYKAYVYADYLYRLLPKNARERIDLNRQIMLVNSKISEGETVSIRLGDDQKPIKGENPKAGKPKNDNEDLLSRIIDKVNIMYQGQFSEADRVIVESIYDKMVSTAKKKLTKQANNTDEKQFEESIFPQIFDEVARGCYVEQMDSFAKLFENSDFYRNVMTQMARVMYDNYKKKETELPFIPELFKQKLLADVEGEFADLKAFLPDLDAVAACFIRVLNVQSTSSIDGANELLLDSFNRLYCLEGMKLVDKRRHFNTIVTKYEVFLKKVYYLLNGEEMVNRKDENSMPTFINCILSLGCLRGLRNNPDGRYHKFYDYLELVKQWRNSESHTAPDASMKELDSAIHVVSTMYLWVISQNMKALNAVISK